VPFCVCVCVCVDGSVSVRLLGRRWRRWVDVLKWIFKKELRCAPDAFRLG
jgi:hypothetical protein